jgi:hypothetical protein
MNRREKAASASSKAHTSKKKVNGRVIKVKG